MRMKTKNDGRWSRQHSPNEQSAENYNHTEETHHASAPIPCGIGITDDTQETLAVIGSD
jgi:hypothetical protein